MAKFPDDPRASIARLQMVSERDDPKPARDPEDESASATTARHAEVLERARERWALVTEAERKQRERELEDLKFARGLPEDQWPAEIMAARKGGVGADGSKSPARPTLTVSKIRQPLIQIENELKAARLSVQVKTKSDDATEEVAEVLQGLYRAIEVDSNADYARSWAGARAIKCGRGYYRVVTDYADDGDFDLDIQIQSIHNQGTVYLDPGAVKPDASDMEWAFVIDDVPLAEFKRRWPEAEASKRKGQEGVGALDMTSLTDAPADWIGDDYTRIAEYWEIEHEHRHLWFHPLIPTENNRVVVDKKGNQYDASTTDPLDVPIPLPSKGDPETKIRRVDVRTVRRYIITGCDVLEEAEWDGRWIPILPTVGEKHVIDGADVTYLGVVAPAKDSQRLYNYAVSTQPEALGLTNKAPYILDPIQIEGFEHVWAHANVSNPAWLPAKQYIDGQQYAPPQRNVVEPALAGVVQVTMQADADIMATTGRYEASRGQLSSNERSGKAIRELKQQGETGSSHFLDNLGKITLPHEARIILDLIPHVYDRPGRVLRLLGKEDQERMVMVAGPDGQPMPMPASGMGPQGPQGPMPMGPGGPMPMPPAPPQAFDLSKGQYTVVTSIGKSFASQREASSDLIMALAEATGGASVPFTADLIAKQMDGPIADDLAERMELMNPAIAQAKAAKQQNIPPEAQAMVSAMQQQLQQMQQQLAAATQQIQTEAGKYQAEMQIAQMKIQSETALKLEEIKSRERIAALTARAGLAETRATLDSKEGIELLKATGQRIDAQEETLADERQILLQNALEEQRAGRMDARDDLRESRQAQQTREEREHQARTSADADARKLAMTKEQKLLDASVADRAAQRDHDFTREQTEAERQAQRAFAQDRDETDAD